MHVAGFNLVSVSLNFQFCQCQTQLSVSVSISFFRFWLYCIDSKLLLRYPYLSLSYAPWSEGGCLSSAKLRSTDSVNPRAVLSRVRPRYRLYSKHRDRRCWTGPGLGISELGLGLSKGRSFSEQRGNRRGRSGRGLRTLTSS